MRKVFTSFFMLLVALNAFCQLDLENIFEKVYGLKETDESPEELSISSSEELVDLGLSVAWARYNFGASAPSQKGTMLNSLNTAEVLKTIHSDLRLPTAAEISELINNCQWLWTQEGPTPGYIVKGPNGNTIFLPAVGRNSEGIGTGHYISATGYDHNNAIIHQLDFNSSGKWLTWENKNAILAIRLVGR